MQAPTTPKKAVIYIITTLELGGAQKVCLELFEGCSSTDTDTFLITGTQGVLQKQVQNHPHVFILPELQREVGGSLFSELKASIKMVRLLRRLKKQYSQCIVHTHSTKAGIMGRWAAFFAGISARIHTIHGYAFHAHQSWFTWSIIYALELLTSFITTRFICVSSADVTTGMRLFPFFGKKYQIIRAAVDFSPAQQYTGSLKDTSVYIYGTISCFKPQKNLFDLLEAFKTAHAANPHTRLEIIGDGILRPALEAWIAHQGLTAVITLHGWQDDVHPFLARWHCFVLSSLWEGLPCSVIEARLHKLPVIAYNVGGIKDVITPGKNGELIAPKDIPALTAALQKIQSGTVAQQYRSYRDNLATYKKETMLEQHTELYTHF